MRSFKILIGTLIAILLFFMLIVFCGNTSAAPTEPKALVETPKPVKIEADSEEILRYNRNRGELKSALESYFSKAIASGDIVGAGVSIVKGDSVVVSDGFGQRKINGNTPVDGQTVFRLGSLSKGFAGVLAAELKQEGKLHWGDKVRDFIPGFQLGDNNNTGKITLATILSHTSGTPYHSFTNLVDAGISLKEIVKHFKEIKPISTPGYHVQLSKRYVRPLRGNDAQSHRRGFYRPVTEAYI